MLVQLEGARTNPSLGTLCRVSEALSVSVAALIETAAAPPVQVVPADGGTLLWSGAAGGTGRLLVGSDEREHVELWRWDLVPGDTHGSDPGHADGTLELVHVLDGTLTLDVDGEAYLVGPGCAASYRADRPHEYRNEGSEPCRFVMVLLQNDVDLQAWAASRLAGGHVGGEPGPVGSGATAAGATATG
jgi:quercetin dioxygenase-like cupin family protein